jgi:plastocyanin
MKNKGCVLLLAVIGLCMTAWAGEIEGRVSAMKGHSVVYVDGIAGKTFPAPTKHTVMDQKGLRFVPHIMVVQEGTTVEFLNSDPVQHNVYWPSISGNKKLGHNMGTWPQGVERPYTFDKPGIVPLLCIVHPDMSGYLIVSPTPYFAETDDSGNYKIKDIPDGHYTLTAWHEGDKIQSKSVTVSGTTKADFTLTR